MRSTSFFCTLLTVLFFIASGVSVGLGNQSGEDPVRIVQVAAQGGLARAGAVNDSIAAAAMKSYRAGIARFNSGRDSLLRATRDSLDRFRRDSLRIYFETASPQLQRLHESGMQMLEAWYKAHTIELSANRDAVLERVRAADANGRRTAAVGFAALADSLSDAFRDSAERIGDEMISDLSEAVSGSIDDGHDYARDLLDERAEEIADSVSTEEERASHFVVGLSYTNRATYRGRDGGVDERAYSPSIAYYHRSGLNFAVSASYLPASAQPWDQSALTVGYDFDAGDLVSGGLSYSHFWFRDSSLLSRSVLDQSVSASLLFSLSRAMLGVSAGLDFGNKSEYNFGSFVMAPLRLSRDGAKLELILEPGASIAWGQQNSDVLARRKLKLKIKQLARARQAVSSVFGVMSYDLSIPVSIRIGPCSARPALNYTIPTNVLDGSTSEPYGGFSLDLSVTFR